MKVGGAKQVNLPSKSPELYEEYCDSADTVHDAFCWRSFSVHTWFVDFEIVQATVDFKVVALEFGDANPHLCERGFQCIKTAKRVLHCFHQCQEKFRFRKARL